MVEYVRNCKFLQSTAIVFNYQQPRFAFNIQTILKLFCNIFPMKDFLQHICMVFCKSFTKRGAINGEMKQSRISKVLPVLNKVLSETTGIQVNINVPIFFVDIDPEGLDDMTKNEINRLVGWSAGLNPISTSVVNKNPHPVFKDQKIETKIQENKIPEGDYIIIVKTTFERIKRTDYNGNVTYTDWKVKDEKVSKVLNPDIVELKKKQQEQIKKMEEQKQAELNRIRREKERQMREQLERERKLREERERQIREQQERERQMREQQERERQMREQQAQQDHAAWVNEMADRVMNGEFGNGQQRRDLLGDNYAEIQNEVNRRLGLSKRH